MPELTVYNIRKEKYAHSLVASGVANRWNKENEFILYTASSRALAVLELTVHRAAIDISHSYRIMVMELFLDENNIEEIRAELLIPEWTSIRSYPVLQKIGSQWYRNGEKPVLKVPSAIIPREYNYLLNTQHPGFHDKVKLKETESFFWDKRLL